MANDNFGANTRSDKGILLEVGTNEVEFLEFEVMEQSYAVNVAKVQQVLPLSDLTITPVPDKKNGMLGATLHHGNIITVYDLKSLLNMAGEPQPNLRKLLIVTNFNKVSYGIVVDKISAIHRLSWTDFTPFNCRQDSENDSSVIGTLTINQRLVHCVDFESIMAKFDPQQSVFEYGKKVSQGSNIDRSKIRLLYCEDSPTVQKMVLKILKESGFNNITLCNTGLEGLNHLRSEQGKDINVILSDIEMPEMDGLTFCKTIKSDPAYRKIPVIFFSSIISEEMKIKCESVQGDMCFSKPEIHNVIPAIDKMFSTVR